MGRFRTFRRTWAGRLAGSALFAIGAFALASTAGGSPAGSSAPQPEPEPSLGGVAVGWHATRTYEGTTIVVSDGPWSAPQIHEILMQNGLDPVLGAHMTVRVETAYPPTRITWSGGSDRASGRVMRYPTLWLDAWPGSEFSRSPDRTIAHLLGRLWVESYVRPVAGYFWPRYIKLRGLEGNALLDSARRWNREEILAEDYRLLFGSRAAIAQLPRPENGAVGDPRSIAGLRELLHATMAAP
jgi:hypothetical protein